LELSYFFESIQGTKRRVNQDNYVVVDTPDYKLFCVLDGVGGALNGKEATKIAIDFIKSNHARFFLENQLDCSSLILGINKSLLTSKVPGALTTISILSIVESDNGRKISAYNVGDTRVYSFTKTSLKQISIDDKLTANSHVITQCLGMPNLQKQSIHKYQIDSLCNYILCTDGFYELMEQDKLICLNAFNSKSHRTLKSRLNRIVNGNNTDDSTYLVIFLTNV
jgi:serine/threonine protein phosphatase PrpC